MKPTFILLDNITTTGDSQLVETLCDGITFQASVTGTGAVSATVLLYGSNEPVKTNAVLLATATLSGTTTDTAGAQIPAEWSYVYASCTAISGTSAKVRVTVGA
jgi:Tfp pilus assembly protein PilV